MKVLNGIDHLEDAKSLLKGKRIGLITSSAGVTADLVHDSKIFQKLGFHRNMGFGEISLPEKLSVTVLTGLPACL